MNTRTKMLLTFQRHNYGQYTNTQGSGSVSFYPADLDYLDTEIPKKEIKFQDRIFIDFSFHLTSI